MPNPELPLSGVHVLDLTSNIAGPVATLILANLGATVWKVERPEGDDSRRWGAVINNVEVAFDTFNRGKRSLRIDINRPGGRELILRLAANVDVFVHNLRPEFISRSKLTENDLKKVQPTVVYCEISAFGTGPLGVHMPGYDPIAQAFSGLMDMTGTEDGPAIRLPAPMIDISTGQWAAIGILAALLRGGHQGAKVEASLIDTALGFVAYQATEALITGERPTRDGSASSLAAPHQMFQTNDRPIFIAAANQRLWLRLLKSLDLAHLAADSRFSSGSDRLANRRELVKELSARLKDEGADHWLERLVSEGVPAAVVQTLPDATRHPIAAEREWFDTATGDLPIVRTPLMLDGKALRSRRGAPILGEGTGGILSEIGVTQEEMGALRRSGVLPVGER
jgi:crotonobetainyl-CoA:carnitine CoA-transferase CaiB-like acyl-CoA transferase